MSKKKILRIIARLNIGGPAIHTVLLSSELNRRGYADTLIHGCISEGEGDMSYLAKDKGLKCIVIPELGRRISLKNDIKAFLKLRSIMMREKPDIVHTHTAKAGALGRLAAISAGVPIRIHTFHGHIFDGYFHPIKAMTFLWIERLLAFFTNRVITVSASVKDEIVNKLRVTGPGKCTVIPLGFELEQFLGCEKNNGIFRKELGVGSDTMLVGIIGRLVPIKNHMMFLDAAKNIIDKNLAKVRFVIIGNGETKADLESYAKKIELGNNVIFVGWERDLAKVYAGLDIVTLTSLNEGTPVSIIEAMASAKPVVATDVGGIRDLIIDGENGFLVKSNDVRDFADKVSELLADAGKRELFGMCGRKLVKDKYSKSRLVNDIEHLYEECTKNNNG